MVAGWNLGWQGTERKAVLTGGAGLVCECTGQCKLEQSVQGKEMDTGGVIFLIS